VTGGPLLPYSVRKEIRALVPTWCACAAAIVIAAVWRDTRLLTLAALAYGVGCVALGAQSFGHEYSHRTVGLLLSQPSSRPRTLVVKFATLTAMVVALSLLAWPVVFSDVRWIKRAGGGDARTILVLAALCAICVAPLLSMICRNVLAAIVLTTAIPGTLFVVGDVVGVALYGAAQSARVDQFTFSIFWRGMFLICIVAVILCSWMFARLEAIEGRGTDFQLPKWGRPRDSPAAVGALASPLRQLVSKELRLYQVAIPVVALYVGAYFLVARIGRDFPSVADPVPAMSMLYAALLGMLIGALASAEERQMGTLEWQTLLPMPSWQQWVVKSGVVAVLVLILGVMLPYALRMISPVPGDRLAYEAPREVLNTTLMVVMLTSVCLYVSSLSSSGVRALVTALPVLAASAAAVNIVAWTMAVAVRRMGFASAFRAAAFDVVRAPSAVWLAIVLGFVGIAISFAAINHRSAERPVKRIALQASAMIVYAGVFAIVLHL
jgi:hypothetical protein